MAVAANSTAALYLPCPHFRASLPKSSCRSPASPAPSFAPLALSAKVNEKEFGKWSSSRFYTSWISEVLLLLLLQMEVENTTNPTEQGVASTKYKKIFVSGATGRTGRRVVEQLLAAGFQVRAGSLDVDRARNTLSSDPNLEIVGFFSASRLLSPPRILTLRLCPLVVAGQG